MICRVDISGAAPLALADPNLLKIVFLNLLLNSADALGGHGVSHVPLSLHDTACAIAVVDSGPGIPVDIRHRLFTPFVTTKSRGTGLGLSTVKRLLEAQQGGIQVISPPEGGTPSSSRSAGD